MHPTFASFKLSKQNHGLRERGNETVHPQPRTFQELKKSGNNEFNHGKNPNIMKLPTKTFRNLLSQKQGQMKKCSAGAMFEAMTSSQGVSNAITRIKNVDNIKFPYGKNQTRELYEKRPPIIGPSLIKNKSFIQPTSNQSFQHQFQTGRSLFNIPNNQSIQFSDQHSDSVNRSIQTSYQEGNSYDNGNILSKSFKDSLQLQKKQLKTESKMSFSRQSSRSNLYNPIDPKVSLPDSTRFEDHSQDCPSASKDLFSSIDSGSVSNSYQATQKKTQNSISFSKKLKYHRHQKAEQKKAFTLEDFFLLDEIGQGKYGKVYSSIHKATGFICALKIISKALIKQENIEEPFLREIKIQMYLNHPNIVKLYGFFHDQDNIYLIMESCLDGQLFKLMKERKNFQESEILQILSNIFQAVSFLHCHGIIHRDLKPENIVIQSDVYKLCDFGWAAYAKGQTRSTFCGTPLYVSPEVLKGQEYDAKADVWGLGILTYELAYGRVPFPIWNKSDMIKIVKDPVYMPTWTNVSQKMQSTIKWMLHKESQKRASMNQILSGGLLSEYLGKQKSIKSQIQLLF